MAEDQKPQEPEKPPVLKAHSSLSLTVSLTRKTFKGRNIR